MKQVFDFNLEQFHALLLQTIAVRKYYRLSFQNADRERFTVNYPSKGIVIYCRTASGNGCTELYLSATSPFCVISAAYEQRLLADLLIQINQTIHHPGRPKTAFALRYASRLKGFRFLKKLFAYRTDLNRQYQ
jgi:hypothetical protein